MKEPEPKREVFRKVDIAYLFDVDGVIVDPQEKKVTNIGIIQDIVKKLEIGEPIGLNTGRSTSWTMDRVVLLISQTISDQSFMQNLLVVGEKGATWVTFDEKGAPSYGMREDIAVDSELIERIKRLVEDKYSSSMFFDDTKQTMISAEMRDGFEMSEFPGLQESLIVEVKKIIEELGISNFRIDATTIATDIEKSEVGKALGAKLFSEFIKERGLTAKRFLTFGDSPSDLGMADELHRLGNEVEFVFLGGEEKLKNISRSFPILNVGNFSDGLHSYLLGLHS